MYYIPWVTVTQCYTGHQRLDGTAAHELLFGLNAELLLRHTRLRLRCRLESPRAEELGASAILIIDPVLLNQRPTGHMAWERSRHRPSRRGPLVHKVEHAATRKVADLPRLGTRKEGYPITILPGLYIYIESNATTHTRGFHTIATAQNLVATHSAV